MKLPIPTMVLGALGLALTLPRQPPTDCCFQLSLGARQGLMVLKTETGELRIGGSYNEAWFCFDERTQGLVDAAGHSCYSSGLDQRLGCTLDTVASSSFTMVPTLGNSTALGYGAVETPNTTIALCPATTQVPPESYAVYLGESAGKSGCIQASLFTQNENVVCSRHAENEPGNVRYGAEAALSDASIPAHPSITPFLPASLPSVTIDAPALPSRTCSIAPDAPSLAPDRLWPAIESNWAQISPADSTLFEFDLPPFYPPAPPPSAAAAAAGSGALAGGYDFARPPQFCALQFRFRYCSDLPAGYPCFKWSGMELEALQMESLNFSLVQDTDQTGGFQLPAVVRLWPGDYTVLGTFPCGSGLPEPRLVSWSAFSAHGFQLEFVQGGGRSGFDDGVGVWIVPCS